MVAQAVADLRVARAARRDGAATKEAGHMVEDLVATLTGLDRAGFYQAAG